MATRLAPHFIAVLGLAWIAALPASADSISNKLPVYTIATDKADPPHGWGAFCARYASECVGKSNAPRKIELTATVWNAIVAINAAVNKRIEPISDERHWGKANMWVYPDDGYGDCKAYALVKRRELIKAGFPREAALLATVWTEQDQGHPVLIVRTDKGDYVLDSLSPDVLLWSRTAYDFVERQSTSDPNTWVYIDGYLQNRPVTVASGITAAEK